MINNPSSAVVILDYGLGNIFSIKNACNYVGLSTAVTACGKAIAAADCVILPGVGSFGDAMNALKRLDLIEPLRDAVAANKVIVGICLGMQLLLTESFEFGTHKGLNLIEGAVVRLDSNKKLATQKIPQVGWNKISAAGKSPVHTARWNQSLLEGIPEQAYMYFVHSFYVKPFDPSVVSSVALYNSITFCSSLQCGSVYGFQFHPEKSAMCGLHLYKNLAQLLNNKKRTDHE